MVRHGTVQYGSLLGGFPLGTVPGTFLVSTKKQPFRGLLRKYRQNGILLIAEKRIQRELDGATRNEKALFIYFLHFVCHDDTNQHIKKTRNTLYILKYCSEVY